MSGGTWLAQPAMARPLDGRVRPEGTTLWPMRRTDSLRRHGRQTEHPRRRPLTQDLSEPTTSLSVDGDRTKHREAPRHGPKFARPEVRTARLLALTGRKSDGLFEGGDKLWTIQKLVCNARQLLPLHELKHRFNALFGERYERRFCFSRARDDNR